MKTNLPLKEMSVDELYNDEKTVYEIPIYQRNYAWEDEEISALIQDVYDAYKANEDADDADKKTYFIGTLVSFRKDEQVYEVIDGQQRLTTIYLILSALMKEKESSSIKSRLTYRARKKSNYTIDNLKKNTSFEADEKDNTIEKDNGIVYGYNYADKKINDLVQKNEKEAFITYFCKNVHLIHYQVPKDIDLNHYFEIMNSRGDQLEKHEIIKAKLYAKLNREDGAKFNMLWESCSEMKVYIQQKYDQQENIDAEYIFGSQLCDFKRESFEKLPPVNDKSNKKKISDLINIKVSNGAEKKKSKDKNDTFLPIIDFPNFLLIVLKLTLIKTDFDLSNIILDDKELLKVFEKVEITEVFVKKFSFNLLKAKFFLDNYIVHHSNGNDTEEDNPWMLERWQKKDGSKCPLNLGGESPEQKKLEHLLSMFEVTYTAKQRKNYLFYCLLYLFETDDISDIPGYCKFVSYLADTYFYDVYLNNKKLNENKTPKPDSFDKTILVNNKLYKTLHKENLDFTVIYGDGTKASAGIPLFIFNYLDYKLWEKYFNELRGANTKEDDPERKKFFKALGCNDFGLKVFDQFYFSRTRRSLEHFFPQAKAVKANGENEVPTKDQINCLGNYAMIGSEANSSGSNWDPSAKLTHYWDSGKIKQVSVASIKFRIMMQMCKDNLDSRKRDIGKEWTFEDDIKTHQKKMLDILGVR